MLPTGDVLNSYKTVCQIFTLGEMQLSLLRLHHIDGSSSTKEGAAQVI